MERYYHKRDFETTVPYLHPECTSFILRFWVKGGVQEYRASFDGSEYKRCKVAENGLLVCFHDHQLGYGQLICEQSYTINEDGCDKLHVEKFELDVILTADASVIEPKDDAVYYGFLPSNNPQMVFEHLSILTEVHGTQTAVQMNLKNETSERGWFCVITKRNTVPVVDDGFGNILGDRTIVDGYNVFISITDADSGKGFDSIKFTY